MCSSPHWQVGLSWFREKLSPANREQRLSRWADFAKNCLTRIGSKQLPRFREKYRALGRQKMESNMRPRYIQFRDISGVHCTLCKGLVTLWICIVQERQSDYPFSSIMETPVIPAISLDLMTLLCKKDCLRIMFRSNSYTMVLNTQWWQGSIRADSRFAPSQWETALLCNDFSHWLGASVESAMSILPIAQQSGQMEIFQSSVFYNFPMIMMWSLQSTTTGIVGRQVWGLFGLRSD